MDYIKDAFMRMDLRQIREFLLYGVEECCSEKQSYSDRLEHGSKPIYAQLDITYPDRMERDKVAGYLAQAFTTYEEVYMEMGMKAGARLIYELLLKDDLPTEKK